MSISSATVGGKIKFKIVLLGDQFVGKSSVIQRFVKDRYQQSYNATIGIDFLVRNIVHDNKTYRLQLWDTAGQQRFRSLIPTYLKDSHCGLIVYDLSDKRSLEGLARWLDFYRQNKQPNSAVIVIGNKCDLPQTQDSCKDQDISYKMQKLGVPHYKISAKTGQGVKQLFYKVIDHINDQINKQSMSLALNTLKNQKQIQPSESVLAKSRPIKLEQQNKKQVTQMQSPCC